MLQNPLRLFCWTFLLSAYLPSAVAAPFRVQLAPQLKAGDTTEVAVKLEVGGEMISMEDGKPKHMPLSVDAQLRFEEVLLEASQDPGGVMRSMRHYHAATATIKVSDTGKKTQLPAKRRLVLAEIADNRTCFASTKSPLSREQWDLVNVIGNPLAVNWLMPGKQLSEGDTWQHDSKAIGALLGMDHVAVCDVSSVVTGKVQGRAQLRLSGTVHGTIDGAPTELQLRGAYLFHLERKRITKFNLAVKEKRKASDVVPGLDVTAKMWLVVKPKRRAQRISAAQIKQYARGAEPLEPSMLYEAEQDGFRFVHSSSWYVTAKQSDLISMRLLRESNVTGHCNITTLPARSEGRATTLEEFERDVRQALGENLENVSAATEWTTPPGNRCLAVIANGKVEGVPVQWRHYLVSTPGLPRVSLTVTLEQARVSDFANAERQLIDSLELFPKKQLQTATKRRARRSR